MLRKCTKSWKSVQNVFLYFTRRRKKIVIINYQPLVNFINILSANFVYKSLFGSFFYLYVTREKLPKRHLYKKFAHKMLMKLTPFSWNLVELKTDLLLHGKTIWLFHHSGTSRRVGSIAVLPPPLPPSGTRPSAARWPSPSAATTTTETSRAFTAPTLLSR